MVMMFHSLRGFAYCHDTSSLLVVYISVSAFAIKTQVTCTSTDLTNSYRIESSDDGIMGS